MADPAPSPGGFPLDEEPLRQWILKAYQERRGAAGKPKRALDAIRQFLSGAPGAESVLRRYWFEEDPRASIASFVEDLERTERGLAASTLTPLLAAASADKQRRPKVAANASIFVSSLAGPLALKTGIDETMACALLSAALLGMGRLGTKMFQEALPPPRAQV